MTDEQRQFYNKGYYVGYVKATKDYKGGKCQICGSKRGLQLHHPKILNRKARSLKDLSNLDEIQLVCNKHHPDLKRWIH